ncbi:MAG TPA: chemotaxis protein CheX [Thermodesulfobacteriota bacterium]|nr:chemotaxis protein CheX [Deltaproteobacteria bacterium]HNR12075.1 chemotaxis protein CheX [Thermodesulfobacteriota bacterium]HNU70265.1 chemotaxis protein CheX [Thermodesulfobacteriota bacterium]HOC39116.1 chemotaxis protein CheX [Thermodesulfobacteriota bacterium]HQO77843.1 chemotaxis protein CheX [Thermodesulfobacteriota bacterium]
MGTDIGKILRTVAAEMLEGLAFIFAVPAEEDIGETDSESLLIANVSFSGPFSGGVVVLVSKNALPELAANMLGVDTGEDISVEQQQDALKELLNVICGNLLPAVAGNREIFHIGVPAIIQQEEIASCTSGLRLAGAAKLELDDGIFSMMLYTEKELGEAVS